MRYTHVLYTIRIMNSCSLKNAKLILHQSLKVISIQTSNLYFIQLLLNTFITQYMQWINTPRENSEEVEALFLLSKQDNDIITALLS